MKFCQKKGLKHTQVHLFLIKILGLVEKKFIFGNFFLIANNVISNFYGFCVRIETMKDKELSEDKLQFINLFIGMQWLKNSLTIIMLPQCEKFFVDIILKLLIMKHLMRYCQRKSEFVRRHTKQEESDKTPRKTHGTNFCS